MVLRILASILLLLSVFFAPFWVTVILALTSMAYFKFFIEAVFLLLLSDLLFGVKVGPSLSGDSTFTPVSFLVTLVCFIVIQLLKDKLRLEQH